MQLKQYELAVVIAQDQELRMEIGDEEVKSSKILYFPYKEASAVKENESARYRESKTQMTPRNGHPIPKKSCQPSLRS